jgi:SAM-dependent methyltransferase
MKRQSARKRGRPSTLHHHGADVAALDAVCEEILRRARPAMGDVGLNLGAGHGLVVPLARTIQRIVTVDPSQPILDGLCREAREEGLENLVPIAADLTEFAVPLESIDLVVSNHVFHHLHNADKKALLVHTRRWLRPGGRLVVGDVMYGRGPSSSDQQIPRTNVRSLAAEDRGRRRIAKSLARFGFHFGGSYPAPPGFWITALQNAGFQDVGHVQVLQEAGVVWGHV